MLEASKKKLTTLYYSIYIMIVRPKNLIEKFLSSLFFVNLHFIFQKTS